MTPCQIPPEISQIAATQFSIRTNLDQFLFLVLLISIGWVVYLIIETLTLRRRRIARLYEQEIIERWKEKQQLEKYAKEQAERRNCYESAICARCENTYRLFELEYFKNEWFCETCIRPAYKCW
jgi:hypothetical protein